MVIGCLQRAYAHFKRRHSRIAAKLINAFKHDAHWEIYFEGDFWGDFGGEFGCNFGGDIGGDIGGDNGGDFGDEFGDDFGGRFLVIGGLQRAPDHFKRRHW